MKVIFGILGSLVLIALLTLAGTIIGLNTNAGREFATAKINQLAGAKITISGLGGHFPEDIKLANFSVADANGVWLTGQGAELRWTLAPLLRRNVHISSLIIGSLTVTRYRITAKIPFEYRPFRSGRAQPASRTGRTERNIHPHRQHPYRQSQ
jgi:translocation and assembly module TamB